MSDFDDIDFSLSDDIDTGSPVLRVIDLPFDPLGDVPMETDVEYVSRHHIAECDLICPRCGKVAANRGDFSKIEMYRFPSGEKNEGIRCQNMVRIQNVERACGFLLLASPDTEHGDDKALDKKIITYAECLTFKRIDMAKAIKEKYGEDIAQGDYYNQFTATPQKEEE